ncbi:ABC transporter [Caulobacter segnis]|uniref:Lantibiotic export permease protein n=2 Tax=Caulobacter segnis TaxID=88688 RepID=D5VEL2_CAUST|nr:ABC transporter permease [Caulobacter segnis]ADG09155.1 lantibiotic export permease protein [Caulobacter segnis ATCC 21756]AVQ00971.1 ABC transporter [Caulobacter segnis]
MIAVLSVELRKLNRSLAAVLAVAAPSLIGIIAFFSLLRAQHPMPWEKWLQMSTGVWAFFMLPMSVTALTALVAQMEHGPRAWDHLRALPVARWKLYAAKAICVVALVVVMTLLNQVITWGAVSAASALKPAVAPVGPLDVSKALVLNAKVVAAALLMIAIQLWMALRFASFVPALALGIGGTFFSVVATSAKQGVFFPWQMPVNMLASQPWRVETALALGGGLGLLALIVAIAHLARREVL